MLSIGVQSFAYRSISEPSNEVVQRGSRESFVEPYVINISMIRRRMKTPKLKFERMQIQSESKTDVCLCYLKDKVSPQILKQLKNNISAFSGNSGVGKSTLINGIFKRDITQEGEISKRNRRGKNTTTAIKLYEINENTYIADTPGFSTFDISEIPSQELENYFVEFEREKEKCEFIGCTHIKEKNCGVKQAIEEGKISKERYNRFCKIYEELKQKEERKKW